MSQDVGAGWATDLGTTGGDLGSDHRGEEQIHHYHILSPSSGKVDVCYTNIDLIVNKYGTYLRAAAPAADPGQKKRFVCLRDDTKTKEFAQVRSSFAVTRRCLLLPFASDIF